MKIEITTKACGDNVSEVMHQEDTIIVDGEVVGWINGFEDFVTVIDQKTMNEDVIEEWSLGFTKLTGVDPEKYMKAIAESN